MKAESTWCSFGSRLKVFSYDSFFFHDGREDLRVEEILEASEWWRRLRGCQNRGQLGIEGARDQETPGENDEDERFAGQGRGLASHVFAADGEQREGEGGRDGLGCGARLETSTITMRTRMTALSTMVSL